MSKLKTHYKTNLKLILACCSFTLLLLILILKSTFSSPPPPPHQQNHYSHSTQEEELAETKPCQPDIPATQICTKIPPSLAQALVHYSTSSVIPQQTFDEISVSSRVLHKKSPCNFLVFGLGHDSLMWTMLNYGGRTVFIEEDQAWIQQIKQRLPSLEAHHAVYNTKVSQADELMKIGKRHECMVVSDARVSKCELALKGLPNDIYETEWDSIMVDAPTGYHDGAPGRMGAIYTAGLIARNREVGDTDVFVHDVDRVVEDKFSKAFLCEGYLRQQEGRLRHFNIPSHRNGLGKPFCP